MPRVSKFQEAASSAEAAPERPPLRANPKEEDPRERARKRAEEIREHLGGLDEGTDEFYIPPSIVPDGWTYEWKRHTIFNQEDPAYTVQLRREGWDPVPVDRCARHRSMMPENWAKGTIERKGMVLMERPSEISAEVRRMDLLRARQQVRVKEQQLASTPDGTMTRDDSRVAPKINKSFEAIPIPKD
jgi:hypothetical protein